MKKLNVLLLIASLFIFTGLVNAQLEGGGVCADCEKGECLVSTPSDEFNKAWANYINAFEPIRNALTQGDYAQAKTFLPHLRDAAEEVRSAKIPSDQAKKLRKGVKAILKQTKALLKAAKSGNRDKIQKTLNKLKDAIDRVETQRARYQEHQGE